MSLADLLRDLVIANRILAHEGVVDAYGHISVRHPERSDRFFLSGSRSPELVTLGDIIEYDLDCNPIDLRERTQYTERPIHGAIYRKRPDVKAIVHTHAPYASALAATGTPLKTIHMDSAMLHGTAHLPEWPGVPVADDEGRIISGALGSAKTILLANHGLLAAGASIEEATYLAVFFERAARMQIRAMAAGGFKEVKTELAEEARTFLLQPSIVRGTFAYWARRSQPTRQST